MKTRLNKFVVFTFMFLYSISSMAETSGRGGADGDDNEWLQFLIVGLVVGAIIGFLGGKFASKSKK